MAVPFHKTVVCPVLIDRVSDRATLHALIDEAKSGRGQVVLLSGEAGIGKSRLVAEVRTEATRLDFLFLQGNCFQADHLFPYAPLLDLLRTYLHTHAATAATDLKPSAPELARLLPDLPLLLPQLAPIAVLPALDPEQEKRRLFAVLLHFFTRQAEHHPTLLVIEDIHWCDETSLEFLLHLAHRCSQIPLLLLCTYRSDECSLPVQHFLAELHRERLAQQITLLPLSRDEVGAMLSAMALTGPPLPADVLDTLHPLAEGNPFFIEELLSTSLTTAQTRMQERAGSRREQNGAQGRFPLPQSVQDSVRRRTQRLHPEARRALVLAAVAGRRFNFAVLQHVLRCGEAHLLGLMKELIAAQLVVEESAEQFAFRHALTRQAIYEGLLARERRVLHRTIAEALEALASTSVLREACLADLAAHCYAAELWEKALAYGQLVGEKALALDAPRAAVAHLTGALGAAHQLLMTPPAILHRVRGQGYDTLGEFERAQADYEQALHLARLSGDRLLEWQCLLDLGLLWTGRDYAQAGPWFRQALRLSEQLASPTPRARSLNRLGNWLQNTGRIQEALEAHQEALRLFEMRADRQGMAQTLEMLGMAHYFTGDPARTVKDFFGRAIELFRSLGDSQSLFSTLAARAMDSAPETIESTFSALRTRDECVQDAEEALLLARQTNSPSGQAFVEMATTYVLSSFGAFGPALAHAHEALRIATTIERQEWIAATYGALGQLHLLLLEPDRAVSYLEAGLAGAQALGSMIWSGYLTPYLALACILKREFPRAEAALKTILPRDQQPGNFFERQAARAWGELALAQGEAARALAIAEHLLVSAPGDMQQPIPHLLALKGGALLALQRLEEAAEALEDAKRGAEQRQAPSVLWRIQHSLGQVYHLLKREDQAQREWGAARQIITKLAATIDETALRERFLHTALDLLPKEKLPLPREVARQAFGGLTPREREVAALIAQGKTSREMADLLVVSERTAEVHVSNILGKLGFTSRAQIAAWAVEKGLSKR